jgi:Ca2+-binding EF-hand superfamily protein
MISDLQSKNKPIDFEEFIEIIYSRLGDCKTIDGLQRVFALYDTTGDGFIDL